MIRYEVISDQVVVGTNSEMADFDNRQGHLYGLVHFVQAENKAGRRWVHVARAYTMRDPREYDTNEIVASWNDYDDADEMEVFAQFSVDSGTMTFARLEALAAHLNDAQSRLNQDYWTEVQACYGSDAYISGGWEQVAVDIERDEARFEGYR